jgi:hypothetical protein
MARVKLFLFSISVLILCAPFKSAQAENLGAAQDKLVLFELSFDYLTQVGDDGQGLIPTIRLSLNRRSPYRLVRSSPRLYLLEIPDCVLENTELELPQYAPQDFEGILSFKARQRQDGVVILIGVEEGTRILSFTRGNQIFVRY